ncbi:hypothetical protein V6N11_052650 [Hibiscus sabdariffa]|uniref:Uncharacterized protein n=1 Tax=Hibiscus sabdariffa TaxID=183260 RepID=A0ABR2UAN6_9ROSI
MSPFTLVRCISELCLHAWFVDFMAIPHEADDVVNHMAKLDIPQDSLLTLLLVFEYPQDSLKNALLLDVHGSLLRINN